MTTFETSQGKAADPAYSVTIVPLWFGASHRLIAGRPDTRYGWLDTPEGPCIVKALDLELAAYCGTLLENERAVLTHLRAASAPVPELVPHGRVDWLVTRFAGLSLRVLQSASDAPHTFPFEDRLATWIHFLRRTQLLVDAGAVPIDLWSANLVLPLTQGQCGQVRLHKAVVIDHAHTVVAGMNLRRPVWMDRAMKRVPPELRAALQQDQEALVATFRAASTELPGMGETTAEARERTQRLWAEYDAPQALQRTLDAGRLNCGAAIQFAVAVDLQNLIRLTPERSADALQNVLLRMQASEPSARFACVADAAAALQSLLPNLPIVGAHRHGLVRPEDLIGPQGHVDSAKRLDTVVWPAAAALAATVISGDGFPLRLAADGTAPAEATTLPAGGSALQRQIKAGLFASDLPAAEFEPNAEFATPVRVSKASTSVPPFTTLHTAAQPSIGARRKGVTTWLYALAAAGAVAGALLPLPLLW